MKSIALHHRICFVNVLVIALLLFSCGDSHKRIGEETPKPLFPQGVVQNFTLTYTETTEAMHSQDTAKSRVIAILTSPITEDFNNQSFKFHTFPQGLQLEIFDEKNQKSVVTASHGMVYSQTNIIDLRGDVIIQTHDGKMLETPQLFLDRTNNWIFTEAAFTYTNREEGTVMDGEGIDFNKDFSFFKAHKTYGLMTVQE